MRGTRRGSSVWVSCGRPPRDDRRHLQSDVYATGGLLRAMLAGRQDVPALVRHLVRRALAPELRDGYEDAAELTAPLDAVRSFLGLSRTPRRTATSGMVAVGAIVATAATVAAAAAASDTLAHALGHVGSSLVGARVVADDSHVLARAAHVGPER